MVGRKSTTVRRAGSLQVFSWVPRFAQSALTDGVCEATVHGPMSIAHLSPSHFPKKRRRKYERGESPCRNCQDSRHNDCRPLLDNRLCTCACPTAHKFRDRAATHTGLTEQEQVIRVAPKMRTTDFEVPALDRTQINCTSMLGEGPALRQAMAQPNRARLWPTKHA